MVEHKRLEAFYWIIIGLLGFSRQMPGLHAEKILKLEPTSVVVLFGGPASVNCSTNVTHHQGMGWEATEGSVQMQKNVQLITWSVERLEHWDIQPICFINANRKDKEKLIVTVYKPPERVFISTESYAEPMFEDSVYKLKCDVQNVAPVHLLTVNWYKGDQLIDTNDFYEDKNKFPADKTATIQIIPNRTDDGVQYRCEAELKLGPDGPHPPPKLTSDPLNITVHYGPEVSNCPDVVQMNEGLSLTDLCFITGNPFPDFSWEKDGLTINASLPINRSASGEYKLFVNGDIKKTLIVMYGPEITCGKHYTVREGDSFDPNCTVEGYPSFGMAWHKDGDVVDFPITMQKSDAGQYVLTASNAYNTLSHAVEIEVLYPPIRILELQSARVSIGEDVVLKCSSYAKPRPRYYWIYHNTSNVFIKDQDGVSLLHITHAGSENSGLYSCVAYNDLGKADRTVNVDVQERPEKVSIGLVDHAGPMIEGNNYTLRCDVQNFAPVHLLTVNWYKGKHHIKSERFSSGTEYLANETATLTISPSRNDNITSYSCDAELELSPKRSITVKSNPFNVTVYYKPSIHKQSPQWVPVFYGYFEVLVCKASGYPEPTISWIYKNEMFIGENLTIKENAGEYTCIANNSVGNDTRVVNVVLKEDYLPLIAGFVALVVVIISVFFISIYSIYYKNNKMGHYTVEGATPKAQNGNIAQNGKDSTIPMKKILV